MRSRTDLELAVEVGVHALVEEVGVVVVQPITDVLVLDIGAVVDEEVEADGVVDRLISIGGLVPLRSLQLHPEDGLTKHNIECCQ